MTTHYFPKFSSSRLLALLGSCMGLWLGLGVVQLAEVLISNLGRIWNKCLY